MKHKKSPRKYLFYLFAVIITLFIGSWVIFQLAEREEKRMNSPLVPMECIDPKWLKPRLSRYYFDSARDYYLQENPQPVLFKKSDVKFYRLVDKGTASWYSTKFCLGCHPKRIMANGEKLRDDNYTVAYNHLPLNTWVIVKNTWNGKKVRARVTDRGGFEKYNRIIDLNKATAEAIGCGGLCQVEVWVEE